MFAARALPRQSRGRLGAVLVAILAIVAALLFPTSTSASAATTKPATPVVFVHGYGQCMDAAVNMEGPFAELYYPNEPPLYYSGTPAASMHHIRYYGCDTDGESIQGLGPQNSPNCVSSNATTRAKCPAFLRSPDNDFLNTDIRRFSYELAWYLWKNYGATKPVDLVGHSMGGLITTYALQQVAAHNPAYPSSLAVQTVVTFSTPFAGYDLGTANLELRQMQPSGTDSIIPGITSQGAVQLYAGKYTLWLAEGSSAGCDVVPASTTLALHFETFVVDYSSPCYGHSDYLQDAFKPGDATATLNGSPYTGYHSLDMMLYMVMYQQNVYN